MEHGACYTSVTSNGQVGRGRGRERGVRGEWEGRRETGWEMEGRIGNVTEVCDGSVASGGCPRCQGGQVQKVSVDQV